MNILQGDILSFDGDAIVNPANSFLNHGGGLARVIDTAACGGGRPRPGAGSDRVALYVADHQRAPLVPTGGAYVTSAGLLPYKGIIHAVGPVWGGGEFCEDRLLASAHDSVFRVALERDWRRIAIPAISCGIFGFPVERAADIAVGAAEAWEGFGLKFEVSFYLFEDEHYAAYYEAAGDTPGRRGQA